MKANQNNWQYYDATGSDSNPYSKRASHECTKYPWIATEIAINIIFRITGKKVTSIPVPNSLEEVVKKEINKANISCT